MGGLWDTIKGQTSAAVSIANPDVREEIDPARGAPIKGARDPNLKFAPVNPRPPDDNMDLVEENVVMTIDVDVQPERRKGPGGRPRKFNSDAERQKAYRDRQKQKK